MTPEQFTYWLQGHCELNPTRMPTEAQWEMIKDHLNLVFKKETAPLQAVDWWKDLVKPEPYKPGTANVPYTPPVQIQPYFTDGKIPTITC